MYGRLRQSLDLLARLRIRRKNQSYRSLQSSAADSASLNNAPPSHGTSSRKSSVVEHGSIPISHSAFTSSNHHHHHQQQQQQQHNQQPMLLHSESQMLLHTKHIRGGLSVHVCYTNDIMAVNRWIRRVIYRDPPLSSNGIGSSSSSSSQQESKLMASSSSSSSPPTLPLSVGLDVEWKANRSKGEDNHVAVIQLAIRSHILVFHAHLSRLPPGVSTEQVRGGGILAENSTAGQYQHEAPLELARIFSDPGIRFVGVGVLNDYLKVVRDLRLSIVPLSQLQSEISQRASTSSPPSSSPPSSSPSSSPSISPPLSFLPIKVAPPPTHSFAAERVVEMSEKWLVGRRISEGHGLKALSVRVLSLQGWNSRSSSSSSSSSSNDRDSGTSINHSQWEQPLSNIQIRYAALDAWSSAVVHDVIERHELRMPERDELARRAAAKSVRRVLLREIQFGAARLSSAIASDLVSSSSTATLLDAANVLGVDMVDPTNASFWKEQRALSATNHSTSGATTTKGADSSQNFSNSDPVKLSRAELRNSFVAAMNDSLVKSAAEDVLMWFNQGELTQPPVGGIGHNRAKAPFPKLRRRGLSKARICPDPRFIVDVKAVLGGDSDDWPKMKETHASSFNNSSGSGNQLTMVPLPGSEYVFGSMTNANTNDTSIRVKPARVGEVGVHQSKPKTPDLLPEHGIFDYLLEKMH